LRFMLDRQKDFEHDEMVAADISLSYDEGSNNEAAVYGPANCEDMSSSVAIPLPAPETASTSRVTFCDNNDENDHRYVGLVNQAMTCYLNSLIQTLYMTPEFRNAIYEWKFSGTDEKKNIPFQLQKLFLLLQSSDKTSLETTDLTASFGWQSNEAYDQHDVQELCRLMFDALEHRWRNTDHKTLIQDLYKGTMQDFVKCLKCKTEKVKDDVFLDLPLAVKQFGATESFKSVEEALRAFIKPEILDGNNQYQCEKCKSKQDAEKGLRITHFPYLLTIQLKRFDFDYNTLHRIKLNDRMSFPDVLDLNGFIQTESTQTPTAPKMSYASAARKKTPPPDYSNGVMPDVPEEGILKSQASDKIWLNVARDSEEIQELLRKGPYVYELFSIMVHQGSASGGHYFAYIKNIDQNKWLTFNDTLVQSASLDDIYRTFGGPSGGWNSNTNAYMLMYRQVYLPKKLHGIWCL
jgi:ubiquitin carboxyl-terminal hydrolase 47